MKSVIGDPLTGSTAGRGYAVQNYSCSCFLSSCIPPASVMPEICRSEYIFIYIVYLEKYLLL